VNAAQRKLKELHGTPAEFEAAVMRALGEISVAEANDAIARYDYEWKQAGLQADGGRGEHGQGS